MVVTEKGEVTVVEKAVGRAMEKAVVRNVGVHAVSTGQTPMDHDGKEIKCGKSAFLKQPQCEVKYTILIFEASWRTLSSTPGSKLRKSIMGAFHHTAREPNPGKCLLVVMLE
jgi:hypothetical protein